MKENAIIIRQLDIVKIHIDFSDIDNIYNAIYADRVSTIHTAKTQELSAKLGVHLIGFINRKCDDINNEKACEISGYDYLGSLMFLCKADDKLNPLPFEEDELERVYAFLTTGEIVGNAGDEEGLLGEFLNKYEINPVLPNLSIKPEVTLYENYEKVILLTYDFSKADLGKIGGELFQYSDKLVKKFYKEDEALVAPDETYCVKCKTDMGKQIFYVLIQVLEGRRDKPVIGDIDAFIGADEEYQNETEEDISYSNSAEDVVSNNRELDDDEDEEFETNADFLVPYFIIVEIEASWPENENGPAKYKYVYPLLQAMEPEEDQPYFPYFKNLIKVVDFDYFGDTFDIKVDFGGKKQKIHLELDEPVVLKFDYTPGKPSSHRVGEVKLTLERHEIDFVTVEGKIYIHEGLYQVKGVKKPLNEDNMVLSNLSNEGDEYPDECIAEGSLTGSRYFPWLISDDGSFICMSAAYDDYDDPDIRRHVYIPLYADKDTVSHDFFVSDDYGRVELRVECKYRR